MTKEPQDTGDLLEVPENERLDHDELYEEEENEDAFVDLSNVPEGEYYELSTTSEDEPLPDADIPLWDDEDGDV